MRVLLTLILIFLPCMSMSWSYANLNPVYLLAYNFLGYNENIHHEILESFIGVDPRYNQWCAYFINSLITTVDPSVIVDEPGLARSWLNYGTPTTNPQEGDLVIFSRGSEGWKGHIGFYIKTDIIDGEAYVLVFGGNQNNSVTYAYYAESRVLGYRQIPFIKLD